LLRATPVKFDVTGGGFEDASILKRLQLSSRIRRAGSSSHILFTSYMLALMTMCEKPQFQQAWTLSQVV
jgi:hypothetical protein